LIKNFLLKNNTSKIIFSTKFYKYKNDQDNSSYLGNSSTDLNFIPFLKEKTRINKDFTQNTFWDKKKSQTFFSKENNLLISNNMINKSPINYSIKNHFMANYKRIHNVGLKMYKENNILNKDFKITNTNFKPNSTMNSMTQERKILNLKLISKLDKIKLRSHQECRNKNDLSISSIHNSFKDEKVHYDNNYKLKPIMINRDKIDKKYSDSLFQVYKLKQSELDLLFSFK